MSYSFWQRVEEAGRMVAEGVKLVAGAPEEEDQGPMPPELPTSAATPKAKRLEAELEPCDKPMPPGWHCVRDKGHGDGCVLKRGER